MSIIPSSIRGRFVSAAMFAVLLTAVLPATASAHVLKIDGHISAVLHVNPNDNPITGTPTEYFLWFSDDTGRFRLPDCTCSVAIAEGNNVIANKKLTVSYDEESVNRYEFVKPAVYTMRVSGTPKRPGMFQPFVLDYEVRVASGPSATQALPSALWIGIGSGIGLILLVSYITNASAGKSRPRRKV